MHRFRPRGLARGPPLRQLPQHSPQHGLRGRVVEEREVHGAGGGFHVNRRPFPAVHGIGGSLYFVGHGGDPARYARLGFDLVGPEGAVPGNSFTASDHLTNNVEKGTLAAWANFYRSVLGFEEVRYFDIRSARVGLTSYALRSPFRRFCIPINEADEAKSQINEYLVEYHDLLAVAAVVGPLGGALDEPR